MIYHDLFYLFLLYFNQLYFLLFIEPFLFYYYGLIFLKNEVISYFQSFLFQPKRSVLIYYFQLFLFNYFSFDMWPLEYSRARHWNILKEMNLKNLIDVNYKCNKFLSCHHLLRSIEMPHGVFILFAVISCQDVECSSHLGIDLDQIWIR